MLQNLRETEKNKHEKAMGAAQVAHATDLRNKEKELAEAREQLQQGQRERENLMQEGHKSAADVRAQMLAEMKRKQDEAVQVHLAEIERLKAEHQAQVQSASSSHEQQMETLKMKQQELQLQAHQKREAVGPLGTWMLSGCSWAESLHLVPENAGARCQLCVATREQL